VPDELEQADECLPVRVQAGFQALQQQLDEPVPRRAPVGGQGALDPVRGWYEWGLPGSGHTCAWG
jgi:hypothetical protein